MFLPQLLFLLIFFAPSLNVLSSDDSHNILFKSPSGILTTYFFNDILRGKNTSNLLPCPSFGHLGQSKNVCLVLSSMPAQCTKSGYSKPHPVDIAVKRTEEKLRHFIIRPNLAVRSFAPWFYFLDKPPRPSIFGSNIPYPLLFLVNSSFFFFAAVLLTEFP